MKKNWNNPELKNLSLEFTNEGFDSITFATDASGSDAQAYPESYAETGAEAACFVPVWYFYDICSKKWVSTHTSNLCEAIKDAYSYMRNNYANGCKISES